jgi:hypothetical protein
MLLRLVDHEATVQLTEVDSLWLRGRAMRTGAVVGALVVGGATVAIAVGFCSAYSERGRCDLTGPATVPVVLGGFGGGALLGGGVGALIPAWRLRYARSQATSLVPSQVQHLYYLSFGVRLRRPSGS